MALLLHILQTDSELYIIMLPLRVCRLLRFDYTKAVIAIFFSILIHRARCV